MTSPSTNFEVARWRRLGSHFRRPAVAALGALAVITLVAAGCGSSSSSNSSAPKTASHAAPSPKHGGSATVLETAGYVAWSDLDPATDTNGAADQSLMAAVYGQLFEIGTGGKVIDDLATGYSFSNGGKTITIDLRHGVVFSDGSPFNSAVVAWNWKRDLASTCTCKPVFPGKPPVITAPTPYSVRITLADADGAFIDTLQGAVFDWIASEKAFDRMGEGAFELKPVGAGPFVVVSDTPNSKLVLKRNPHYWQKGRPYLNGLTFTIPASDQGALEDMEANSGNAYEGMSTPELVGNFQRKFSVTQEPSTSPYDIQLNTTIAPFNNIEARKAVYYATDSALLDDKLFDDHYPITESFTAKGGLFYDPKVPGYPTYNLAKAKAAVKASGLDKRTILLGTTSTPTAIEMNEALQTEWDAAGMHVQIKDWDLTTLIAQFEGKKWQAMLQTAGAYDPAAGVGVGFRFASTSAFSGVHSTVVDNYLNKGAAEINPAQRAKTYAALAEYLAKEAYGPFLFPISGYNIADHGLAGPGLTTAIPATDVNPEILWESVGWTNGHGPS